MRIIWRPSAVRDLENIRNYITGDSPRASVTVTRRIFHAVERLEAFPRSGRPGAVRGTREIVVPGLPYIMVYKHDDTDVEIIAIFHGAQNR